MPVFPLVASTIVVRPGLDSALSLGRLDHRDPDAVLHASARIERLELSEQLDLGMGSDPGQLNHRRAADMVGNVGRDSRHSRLNPTRCLERQR